MVVYRLITCGTVEEKMYRKQVFKGGLARTGTEAGVQFRYFSHQVRWLLIVAEMFPSFLTGVDHMHCAVYVLYALF